MSSNRRTPAQVQASRENGKKSRGPITPEGKSRSRANALTHGLATATVFPNPMQQQVDLQARLLNQKHRPQTPDEDRIVHIAAVAAARIAQVAQAEIAHTQARVTTALDRYDTDRQQQINTLVNELFTTDTPAIPLAQLEQLTEGCDHLAAEWNALRAELDNPAPDLLPRARRLLGLTDATPAAITPHAQFLADLELLVSSPLPPREGQGEGLPDAFTPSNLVDRLRAFITARQNHYTALADARWKAIDEPLRNAAPRRAYIDLTPEGMRLLRYINSAARLHQQAQNALKSIPDRSQTQAPRQLAPTPPPPAQNEPDTPQLSDTQRVKPSEPPRGTSEPRPVPPARPPLNRRQRRALLKMR